MRLFCLLLVLALTSFAQEFRAVISGTVTDATGAPVPGVKVVAQSVERRVEYPSATNDAGRYVTPFLPPGAYSLRAEKDGFKPVLREGITLAAVDRLNLDIRLEIGSVADGSGYQHARVDADRERGV